MEDQHLYPQCYEIVTKQVSHKSEEPTETLALLVLLVDNNTYFHALTQNIACLTSLGMSGEQRRDSILPLEDITSNNVKSREECVF